MPGYVYRKDEPPVVQTTREAETRPGRKLAPFDPSLCGQNKGYQQHYRHGQTPCDRCKRAHTDYELARQAKHKQ